MPIYEYEHEGDGCELGKIFDHMQSMSSDKLTRCPNCKGRIKRLISAAAICTPKTDSELKSMGFTKLVRRDKGVYENVTARDGDSRIWDANKPDTKPDLSKTIED